MRLSHKSVNHAYDWLLPLSPSVLKLVLEKQPMVEISEMPLLRRRYSLFYSVVSNGIGLGSPGNLGASTEIYG